MLVAEHRHYLHYVNEGIAFTACVKITQVPKNMYLTAPLQLREMSRNESFNNIYETWKRTKPVIRKSIPCQLCHTSMATVKESQRPLGEP